MLRHNQVEALSLQNGLKRCVNGMVMLFGQLTVEFQSQLSCLKDRVPSCGDSNILDNWFL